MDNSSYFRFDDDKTKQYILSAITRELGELKTYSPMYWIMENSENMLNLTHTLDKIYLAVISLVQCLQIILHNDDNEMV